MKLRNKKTGEIINLLRGELSDDCGDTIVLKPNDDHEFCYRYNSLTELNEEWEDYEEPKGIQCIYYVNHFDAAKIDGVIVGFETKEEAEKAVEKLKAITRLKSCGFKFKGWRTADLGADKYYFVITAESDGAGKGDLDLLFGGEE